MWIEDKNVDDSESSICWNICWKVKSYYAGIISDIFFVQERVWKWGTPIQVYKIRTMVHDADKNVPKEVLEGNKEKIQDTRIISSRNWMRKSVNILKWEMSLIWVRPIPSQELECYTEPQKQRYLLRNPWVFWWHIFKSKGSIDSLKKKQDLFLRLRIQKEKKPFPEKFSFYIYIVIWNLIHIFSWNHR